MIRLAAALFVVCRPPPAAPPEAVPRCMSDERQWGTTCCTVEPWRGGHDALHCRGPQIGKPCTKSSDCDIACACDPALVHHDGERATGTCTGLLPPGEWLCHVGNDGRVVSMIID
ncbi:MAG TPA: hypothetical protein VLX92_27415 [Kofleriaceae bacterium]|nr:hypothetical protein [Kofleriaceae bacterium]